MIHLIRPPKRIISDKGIKVARASLALVDAGLRSQNGRNAFRQIRDRFFEIALHEGEYWRDRLAEQGHSDGVIAAGVMSNALVRGQIETHEIGSVRDFLRTHTYGRNGAYPTADMINLFMRALATRNSDLVKTIAMEGNTFQNEADDYGRDGVMHAILSGDPLMVRLAIKHCGVSREWKDSFGQTVFDYANASENSEIISLVTSSQV